MRLWVGRGGPQALISVANTFLSDLDVGAASPAENTKIIDLVVQSCVNVHQAVEKATLRYYDELRRYVRPLFASRDSMCCLA